MINRKQLRQVRKLCRQFADRMQALFDEMQESVENGEDTYATECCNNAVQAQGYARTAVDG